MVGNSVVFLLALGPYTTQCGTVLVCWRWQTSSQFSPLTQREQSGPCSQCSNVSGVYLFRSLFHVIWISGRGRDRNIVV